MHFFVLPSELFGVNNAVGTIRSCLCYLPVIRPLSGTSSFSNDTVRFTSFLFTMVITFVSISQLFLGELKFDKSFPLLVLLGNRKKRYLSLRLLCYCKTYKHRCQRKQMHRNYLRITTALCQLTAV